MKLVLLVLSALGVSLSLVKCTNVIIILADDLGYGDLQDFGHPSSLTPNLNALRSRSRSFANFYASNPVCSPSRSSLLTGLYPVSTGVYPGVFWSDSTGGMKLGIRTLADILRDNGYRTKHVGKWHLGVGRSGEYLPTQRGFDSYFGVPYSHDMCPCRICGPKGEPCFDQCSTKDVSCPLFRDKQIIEQPVDLPTLTQRYTQESLDFILDESKKPFFLYLAHNQPHHPQFAGVKFRNKTLRGSFGDALAEMDDSVGQILRALKDGRMEKDTLVIFTSDNGPSIGRHERGGCAGLLRCGKATTFEGGQRVPAFFSWPGRIVPGVASSGIISNVDLVPTVASLVNASGIDLEEIHGCDQKLFILGKGESCREDFLYFPDALSPEIGPFALRQKQYKAHFYTQGRAQSDDDNYDPMCRSSHRLTPHDPPLLFDLDLDPGERFPLDQQKHKDIIQRLTKLKDDLMVNLTWVDSETGHQDRLASPCCTGNPNCQPFPQCCDCQEPILDILFP